VAGGTVAQQIIVELLLTHQVGIESVQCHHIARKHVAHQDTENGNHVLGTKDIVQLEYNSQEVKSDQYGRSQKAYNNGNHQDITFETSARKSRFGRHKHHDKAPQEVNPGIIPQKEVLQVDTYKKELHHHADGSYDGSLHQSCLEPVKEIERYEQE